MARIQLVTDSDIFVSDDFELPAKEPDKSFEFNCKARERFVQKKLQQLRLQYLRSILRAKNSFFEIILDSKLEFIEEDYYGEAYRQVRH